MSILKADLIQNRAGNRPPGVTGGDFVKAWGRAGVSADITGSFGISSIVDNGAGSVGWNFAIPFAAATYGSAPSYINTSGMTSSTLSATVSSITQNVYNLSNVATDPLLFIDAFFGAQT